MPSLRAAILYAILSAVSFVLASDYGPRLPTWVRFILVAIGIIFAAGAIAEGINWMTYTLARRIIEIRKAQTISPLTEMLAMMARLSPQAQTELALHFHLLGVDYRALIGHPEPAFIFSYNGHNIPFDFIATFFSLSDDRYLPAVRQWTEGSHHHMWADALTAYLVRHGYADAAIGNRPASWRWEHGRNSKRYIAMQAFGLTGDDVDEQIQRMDL